MPKREFLYAVFDSADGMYVLRADVRTGSVDLCFYKWFKIINLLLWLYVCIIVNDCFLHINVWSRTPPVETSFC
jgi:hypothetical protein